MIEVRIIKKVFQYEFNDQIDCFCYRDSEAKQEFDLNLEKKGFASTMIGA